MKILIVSDAWHPQVNGVVRTLATVKGELENLGHGVDVIGPEGFFTLPLPSYPEIRLAVAPGRRLTRLMDLARPDAIHIATEGPLGFAARRYCLRRRLPFTTAYHTRFPEYVRDRIPVPLALSYAVVRRFHRPSAAVMVATPSLEADLMARGFGHLARWTRGVDTTLFCPAPVPGAAFGPDPAVFPFPRPILLSVGRVAVEKNLEAFLRLPLPGTKVVVGDGPQRTELNQRYPDVQFLGARHGAELARCYAGADVFAFPSRTDTFGLVLLEALACGTPVAAFPVPGPQDVLGTGHPDGPVGALNDDLQCAIQTALALPRSRCRDFALTYSWRASAEQFLENLRPFLT